MTAGMGETLAQSQVDVPGRDASYLDAVAQFGMALERLARGYETDADQRRDLLQEIHVALWRSLTKFDQRCSLRTWVYRVAHNVAASHVTRQLRWNQRLCGLEELENLPADDSPEQLNDEQQLMARVLHLVHSLKPLPRQIILSYLEGIDATGIAEITGLTPGNVATQISRIKTLLARRFHQEAP